MKRRFNCLHGVIELDAAEVVFLVKLGKKVPVLLLDQTKSTPENTEKSLVNKTSFEAVKKLSNRSKFPIHLSFSRKSTITVNLLTYFLILSDCQDGCHKT